ncbi:hypothetical protein V502_10454 [Pseudogymnoascus sp. VKM F-4520 (FW-2644)]|nr:hypothetical protein V502_10454 [Pseudogymnoascus sp. VKM F-4520 (FW-2644)]
MDSSLGCTTSKEANEPITTTTTIFNIPPEIILMLMKGLMNYGDNCSPPISLSYGVCPDPEKPHPTIFEDERPIDIIRLDTLLREFFPPEYRLSGYLTKGNSAYFLRRQVYGGAFGLNELKLRERYEDYDLMTIEYNGVRYRLLPNPYNMGIGWYEQAYRKLRETEFPGWSPGVRKFWNNRVEKTHVFKMMQDKDTYCLED